MRTGVGPKVGWKWKFFIGKWKGPNGKKVKVGKWWKSEISTFFIYCFNSPPSFIVDGGNASVPQNFCFFSLASARLPLMSMGMETLRLHTQRRWNQWRGYNSFQRHTGIPFKNTWAERLFSMLLPVPKISPCTLFKCKCLGIISYNMDGHCPPHSTGPLDRNSAF